MLNELLKRCNLLRDLEISLLENALNENYYKEVLKEGILNYQISDNQKRLLEWLQFMKNNPIKEIQKSDSSNDFFAIIDADNIITVDDNLIMNGEYSMSQKFLAVCVYNYFIIDSYNHYRLNSLENLSSSNLLLGTNNNPGSSINTNYGYTLYLSDLAKYNDPLYSIGNTSNLWYYTSKPIGGRLRITACPYMLIRGYKNYIIDELLIWEGSSMYLTFEAFSIYTGTSYGVSLSGPLKPLFNLNFMAKKKLPLYEAFENNTFALPKELKKVENEIIIMYNT